MSVLDSGVFTYELTNDSITIVESMGVKQISVYNGTATDGTVLGTRKLGALASSALTVNQGKTVGAVANEGSVIKNLVITAPLGCTLEIMVQ